MPVFIALLRGVNLGAHNKVNMAELRSLCTSLKFRDAQTYIQSGNLIFATDERSPSAIGVKLQAAIHKKFVCRPEIVLRTPAELREVVAGNPFAKRRDVNPAKLLVSFLAAEPSAEAGAKLRALKPNPEELHIRPRELYIYFPNGMGRSKFPWATLDKLLGVPATGRNWNTVLKLLEMSEQLRQTS